MCVSISIQLGKKKRTKNRKDKKSNLYLQNLAKKIQPKSFMRGGGKQHYNWKLDDERRKRSATSSVPASPITTYNISPGNYTHDKTHTGIIY